MCTSVLWPREEQQRSPSRIGTGWTSQGDGPQGTAEYLKADFEDLGQPRLEGQVERVGSEWKNKVTEVWEAVIQQRQD